MQSHDEILERIRGTLQLFQLDAADVTPAPRLYEHLEIDSIDVIDPMDEVQRHTARNVTPEDFRSVHTATWWRSCSGCCMRENG